MSAFTRIMTPAADLTDPETEIQIHIGDGDMCNSFRLGDRIGQDVQDGIYDGWGFGDRSHMIVIQNDTVTEIVEVSKTGVLNGWTRRDWSNHNKVIQDLCKRTKLPLAAFLFWNN